MSIDMEVTELGQGALAYVHRVLLEAGPIARSVEMRMSPGSRVTTWAGPGSDGTLLDAHVQEGGWLVAPGRPKVGMVPIENPSRGLMIAHVTKALQPGDAVVVDDPLLAPGDLDDRYPHAYVYASDRVAHVLRSGPGREIVDFLERGLPAWEWCGILVRAFEQAERGNPAAIARASFSLVCPAFDHEGWLVVTL